MDGVGAGVEEDLGDLDQELDDGPRAHGGLVVCEEAHVRGGHEEVPCALGVRAAEVVQLVLVWGGSELESESGSGLWSE